MVVEAAQVDPGRRRVAQGLARALLHGPASPAEVEARAARALGRKWPWLRRLVREVGFEIGTELRPDQYREIERFILALPAFQAAFDSGDRIPELRGYFTLHPAMHSPPATLAGLRLPRIDTTGDLARWLNIRPEELEWFADVNGWGDRSGEEKRRHYTCRWLPKASGGLRLLEIPKPRLREIQRRILRGLLNLVPVHPAAQGCVPGRSTMSNAAEHVGSPLLIRLDLQDFFASVDGARVRAVFRTLGYPPTVARYLAALTTHCVSCRTLRSLPHDAACLPDQRREERGWAERYRYRHLPQGASTSPALANLCAFRLDLRLAGVAKEIGGHYTRYVDDLFISCGAAPGRGQRIALMATAIILEEGFSPNTRKTMLMPQAVAQRVTGLLVNAKINTDRRQYERLKATLTNCLRTGPEAQNRDALVDFRAHLRGRIAHVARANAQRGARLMALFHQIAWARPGASVE